MAGSPGFAHIHMSFLPERAHQALDGLPIQLGDFTNLGIGQGPLLQRSQDTALEVLAAQAPVHMVGKGLA